jgi:hypothetical protein
VILTRTLFPLQNLGSLQNLGLLQTMRTVSSGGSK